MLPVFVFAQETSNNASWRLTETLMISFEGEELAHFYQLALCESSGRQSAMNVNKNGTIDRGLLQINSVHEPEARKLGLDYKNSIEDNVRMARIIYDRQGYSAWLTCSTKLGLV